MVCLGCKFPGILDVLPHQVGSDVQGQEVEKEALENEAFGFMDPMIQRK